MYCFVKLLYIKFLKILIMSGIWFIIFVLMWNYSLIFFKNLIFGILFKSCLLIFLEVSGKFLFFLRFVFVINEINFFFLLIMGSFFEI